MVHRVGTHDVRPLSLEEVSDAELHGVFGRFYWCSAPQNARKHLQGAELWGVRGDGWLAIIGAAVAPDGSLAITPWTPAASSGVTGERDVLLALLGEVRAVGRARGRKLVSRMRDVLGEHAPASVDLLRAAGFRRVGLRYSMSCALDEPAARAALYGQVAPGAVTWDSVADPLSVLDLALACFRASEDAIESDWSREEWQAWLLATGQGDRGTFLPQASEVCIVENRAVGFCLATESAEALYLSDLGVLPELRGRGLGQALLQRFLLKGASLAYKTSTLMVAAENASAIRLYERYGYRRKACVAMGELEPESRL